VRSVVAVLRRPTLWPIALRVWAHAVPPRWWAHAPFLPLPDRGYLRFRLETAYGAGGTPAPEDLVTYLRWCRDRAYAERGRRHAEVD
jgi:hypothetical protein